MKCPNCKTEMDTISVAGAEIDYCSKCNGYWLDEKELDTLQDARDLEMRWMDIDPWADSSKISTVRSNKECPRCRMGLHEVTYKDSDIKLDACKLCKGVWLDSGELDNILSYVKWTGKYDIFNNYGEILSRELWEVFSGPKTAKEELADFIAVLKLLKYKFLPKTK